MNTLTEIYEKHSIPAEMGDMGCGDKGHTHSYISVYENLLAKYRQGCSLLEIGLAQGHSMRMWDEYFSNSILHGIDLSLVFQMPEKVMNQWFLYSGDATKEEVLNTIPGNFDIVIDDGDHTHQSQLRTLELLKSRMNHGGIYIIEDILNIDISGPLFQGGDIIDLRPIKQRFDDVLVVYRF